MLLLLLLLIIALVAYYLLRDNGSRVERFQASCTLQPTSVYEPKQVQALVDHAVEQVNLEIATHNETINFGPASISGIGSARIVNVNLGGDTQIRPCTSSCVCAKSDRYAKAAAIQLSNTTATIDAPEIEIGVFLGIKMRTKVNVTVEGLNATLETDCGKQLTITAIDFDKLTINEPAEGTRLRRLIDKIPDHKGKVLAALNSYVVGKNFELPMGLETTPLLCVAAEMA